MSIKINLPSYLKSYTNEVPVVEVNGGNVRECLDHLIKKYPNIEKMMLNKEGKLLDYVSIYVDGDFVYGDEMTKPVEDGSQLYLFYIISGG